MDNKIWEIVPHIGITGHAEVELLHKGNNRQTWLVLGEIPWGVTEVVVKAVGDGYANEIRFYKELLLSKYHPKIYIADTDELFVVMERVDLCGPWGDESLRAAIRLMADMHADNWENKNTPKWLPSLKTVTGKQQAFFQSAMGVGSDIIAPYVDTLTKGAEMVVRELPKIVGRSQTVVHGDFMYTNMGVGENGLALFDWSNVKLASPAYDLCYALEQFIEVFGNMVDIDSIIGYYIRQMAEKGINLDAEQFRFEYMLTYLYRCLFNYIPNDILKGRDMMVRRKVPLVSEMIRELQ